MRFGQLVTFKAKIRHQCRRDGCTVEIEPGEEYIGLLVRGQDKKPFTLAFHQHCFLDGVDQMEARRSERIKERQAAPRPHRVIQLDPEAAEKKKKLVARLSVIKKQLMLAYINSNTKSIRHNKTSLVKVLTELNQPEFVKPYWWRFGTNLQNVLEKGVDPLITKEDAVSADHHAPEDAIRLLSQELDQNIDVSVELQLAKGMLTSALISREGEVAALENLARNLDYPQALFRWGESLAAAIATRSDIFTWDELIAHQDSNEEIADYLRALAGRLRPDQDSLWIEASEEPVFVHDE